MNSNIKFARFDSDGLELVVNTGTGMAIDKTAWRKTGLPYHSWDCLSEFFAAPSDLLKLMLDNMASSIVIDCETGQIGVLRSADINLDTSAYITLVNNYHLIDEINSTINLPLYTKVLEMDLDALEHKKREEIAKNHRPKKEVKRVSDLEFVFESQLEAFLQVNDIHVERQVRAMGLVIDLWIPDQLIVEVKAGKVSGNDACQAIDYLITFGLDVLLIGTGISKSATRAIEAVNKVSSISNRILFVTKDAAFGYLKGVCKS
jgi:hypothetical protein